MVVTVYDRYHLHTSKIDGYLGKWRLTTTLNIDFGLGRKDYIREAF